MFEVPLLEAETACYILSLSAHLKKKMLLLPHIWGWESVPLLRGQHMFWLHSRLLVQIRLCLYEWGSCLHLRSTDGSTGSGGWNLSRFFFFFCYESVRSFHSALTEEVVSILAHKIIRSYFNSRFPIATFVTRTAIVLKLAPFHVITNFFQWK